MQKIKHRISYKQWLIVFSDNFVIYKSPYPVVVTVVKVKKKQVNIDIKGFFMSGFFAKTESILAKFSSL